MYIEFVSAVSEIRVQLKNYEIKVILSIVRN